MTRLHSRAAVVLSFAVNVVVTHAQPSESSKPPGASLSYVANDPLSARALRHRFSADQLAVMKMLNRADAARLPSLSLLIVPQSWPTKPLSYSPSPFQYDAYNDTAKPIVVDQAAQAFAAYEYGRLVRWEPVNSGRRSMQTPAGLFHLNWRSRGRHSTVDPSWFMPWYFNFHNTRGLSFHEYALPGRPASHACIRTQNAMRAGSTSGARPGRSTNAAGTCSIRERRC